MSIVDRRDGSTDIAVSVRDLMKAYEGTPAVRGVDFDIYRGEIFALLGPNGAGKTTTVEILEGYRSRDQGEVSVLGFDPGKHADRIRPLIGIVLQSTGVDRYLTVKETVAMYASFYPHPRPVDEVISLVGLDEKRDARVLKLSGDSSAVSTSPSRSPAIRTFCSSTSRRRDLIPRRAAKRGRS